MITRVLLIISLFFFLQLRSQSVSHVYKIDGLLNRISNPDTTYVVNFWATWCKPCVQELPGFDSLYKETNGSKIKVLLVSLDFKEDLDKKVNPFLAKNHIVAECVLLDEINGNDFVNKIAPVWSGAIPATLFRKGKRSEFMEKKIGLKELWENLGKMR